MRRGESVNASDAPVTRVRGISIHPAQGFEFEPPSTPADALSLESSPEPEASLAHSAPAKVDQGPCLYFGPRGERCYRRAVRNGFCAFHQPAIAGSKAGAAAKPSSKVIAAILGLLGMLLPFIDDIVRTVMRWLHSH